METDENHTDNETMYTSRSERRFNLFLKDAKLNIERRNLAFYFSAILSIAVLSTGIVELFIHSDNCVGEGMILTVLSLWVPSPINLLYERVKDEESNSSRV